jgi:hypothetical protein
MQKEEKKMKNKLVNTKINTLTMLFVLLLSMILVMTVPTLPANAQLLQTGAPTYSSWQTTVPAGVTPSITIPTTAFMSVSPNPIGKGQEILVNLWMEPPTQTNRYFSGFTVTITKPDNTTDTVGPLNSYQGDATEYFTYKADQAGTWKFVFNFAGNYFPNGTYFQGKVYNSPAEIPAEELAKINPAFAAFAGPIYLDSAYYEPSTSKEVYLTVQEDMVYSWQGQPLPTDYWTRPIPNGDREWWTIGGQYPFTGQGGGSNWPADTNAFASNYKFTPYVQAPNTAHVVWARQGALGGIVGGQYGYNSAGAGEGTYAGTPTIIFQGRAYQSVSKPATVTVNGATVTQTTTVWQCYDIRTGKILWEQSGITQIPTYVTYNTAYTSEPGAGQTGQGAGTYSLLYIGSGRLIKYDPWSGAVTLNVSTAPVTSGTLYNEPYVLSVYNAGNTTNPNYRLVNWTTTGTETNFTKRIMSNVAYPFSSLGTADYESMVAVNVGSITPLGAGTPQGQFVMGASLTTGQLRFNTTVNDIFYSTSTGVADHGKYAVRCLGGFWDCFSFDDGKLAWQSPELGTDEGMSYPWGDFGAYTTASYGGLVFDFSYAGFYALDWDTGKIVWHLVTPATPFESPQYPNTPLFSNSPTIADGKLYYSNGEHSPTQPLARGWRLWCINATTGDVLWSKLDGGSPGAVADGYLTFDDRYDGYMYVFGKGTSVTTISAPQTQIASGTSVVLSGKVLDNSPGIVAASTAPSGSTAPMKNLRGLDEVACVSADSMNTYMEYLYGQEPIDSIYHNVTVTGVPVSIYAINSDGESIHIGDTVSDSTGGYSITWKPTVAGDYTITATFAGDDSYGSSWAQAYATVVGASESSPTTSQVDLDSVNSTTMTTVIAGVIAIIIALALVTVLILRKH